MQKTILLSNQRKTLIFALGAICAFGILTLVSGLSSNHGYTKSSSMGNHSENPIRVEESISKTANSGHSHSVSHSTTAFKFI